MNTFEHNGASADAQSREVEAVVVQLEHSNQRTRFETDEADRTSEVAGHALLASLELTDKQVDKLWEAYSEISLDDDALESLALSGIERVSSPREGDATGSQADDDLDWSAR